MTSKLNFIILYVLILAVGGFQIYNSVSNKKVAYVHSEKLIYSYDGTKAAITKFNNKKSDYQASIDSLQMNFKKGVDNYNLNRNSMSKSERQRQEELLNLQKRNLDEYVYNMEQRIKEEDGNMMTTILDQINSSVKDYGEANGYKIIFGTTSDGSILYGEDQVDITDELVEYLNKQYEGVY